MRKARILRNAAEIHEHFFGKSGAPGKWKAAQRYSPPDPPFTHHD
jgi:hypothetical protein